MESKKRNISSHPKASLVSTDSPDDFQFEGKFKSEPAVYATNKDRDSDSCVAIDNPDDLE